MSKSIVVSLAWLVLSLVYVCSADAETVSIQADADSFVLLTQATTNFGARGDIRTTTSPDICAAYTHFDLSNLQINSLTSAKLQLQVTDVYYGSTDLMMEYHGIIDNADWDLSTLAETAITWNNAPKNNTADRTFTAGSYMMDEILIRRTDVGSVIEMDVTEYIKWSSGLVANTGTGYTEFAAEDIDDELTIMLQSRWGAAVWCKFGSKENTVSALIPTLVLEGDIEDCPPLTNCTQVWANGFGLDADFNEDCRVDFLDFAEFCQYWLVCNDPKDGSCISNW